MSLDDKLYADMEKILVGEIRVNMVVLHNDRPIKVTYFHTGKTGKHGAAKTIVKGFDVITDKHVEFSDVTSKPIWLPKVTRKEMSLIDIIDDHVTVFDDDLKSNFDYRMNESDSVTKEIIEHNKNGNQILVLFLFVIGEYRILSCKLDK